MSDDHTQETLDEIRRRRKALLAARASHAIDQRFAAVRDVVARTPLASAALAHMLFEPERYRLQLDIDGEWVDESDETVALVFLLASLALTQAKLAADEQENADE